jgi:predicted nucleic acid-binding protein
VNRAVSNAGPLLVLAKLNLLHLLETLYDQVHIPHSVYRETVVEGLRYGHEDARRLSRFLERVGWQAEDVPTGRIPDDLRDVSLDTGERDALALALCKGDACVLMDESLGRAYARQLGLDVRGSLGVLVEAYHQSILDADRFRSALDEIVRRHDIWISPTLVKLVLWEVLGE